MTGLYRRDAMSSPSRGQIRRLDSPTDGPFSAAVVADGFVYLSGMLAEDDEGAIVGAGVAEQTHRILERAGRLLQEAGSTLAHVVSVTVYLRSAAEFQTMNGAYRPFFPQDPPTRTTVITDLVVPEALVEITMIAVPRDASREVVHPSDWMRSPNPYSYAVRAGETVFLSGLVPRKGRDNSPVRGDVALQTRTIIDNATQLLDTAGLSLGDIVASRVYLTRATDFQEMNRAYRDCFGGSPPARATVTCGLAGPDFQVEMTFTASSAARQAIGIPPEGIPITPAIRSGKRLYLSGMLGNTPSTAGDVAAQTRETLARIRTTLETAGAGLDGVVDATVYLKHAADWAAMNDAYRAFFPGGFPARTTVGAPLVVDDGLVEIMVTAVAP
jgi:enamine deaminase RidA (YjgF/YER057c/UK114 family)